MYTSNQNNSLVRKPRPPRLILSEYQVLSEFIEVVEANLRRINYRADLSALSKSDLLIIGDAISRMKKLIAKAQLRHVSARQKYG